MSVCLYCRAEAGPAGFHPTCVPSASGARLADAPEHRALPPPLPVRTGHASVRVVDVEMPFGSMVVFMVKWSIAAIPALLILVIVTLLGVGLLSGVVRGLAGRP